MTTQILGVKPTAPGFAELTIQPHPGDVDSSALVLGRYFCFEGKKASAFYPFDSNDSPNLKWIPPKEILKQLSKWIQII
jgi:hypothetical protein